MAAYTPIENVSNSEKGLLIRGKLNAAIDRVNRLNAIRINVKDFGAVGDGETDDAAAIQDAFDYARDNGYAVEFESEKTYLLGADTITLDFYGGLLEGNGATIQCSHIGEDLSSAITVTGELSAAYNIDGRAIAGNDFIDISDAEFLSSVNIGDMIIIRSEKAFSTLSTGKQGETCIIADVQADRIDLVGKLNDTYLVSDSAIIYLVDAPTPIIRNLNVLQNKDKSSTYYTYGIHLLYCNRPLIDNCNILWAKFTAFAVNGCYRPIVRHSTAQVTDKDGLGYGLQFFGPCTNPFGDGNSFKANRHSVAHGGTIYGVPHNSLNANTFGESIIGTHVFDAHGDTGSVTWNNCIAIGGFNSSEDDKDDVMGEWDSTVTYTIGQIVGKDKILWELTAASSLNEDPTTESAWAYYNNVAAGFMCRSDNQSIINCRVVNCAIGINAYGLTVPITNFYVDGLFIENCTWGIRIGDGTELISPHFDNITIENKYYKTGPYMVELDDCVITTGYWGNIHGSLIKGIEARDVDSDIQISEFWCHAVGLWMIGDCLDLDLRIDSLNIAGIGSGDYNLFIRGIESLIFGEVKVTDAHVTVMGINGAVGSLLINRLKSSGDIMESAIRLYSAKTVSILNLNEASIISTSGIDLIRNEGIISVGRVGTYSGDVNEEYYSAGSRAVLEIVNGDFNSPLISKGIGSPEGVVIAGLGSTYNRLDGSTGTSLYIKESGTGNTGWIAK